MSYSKDWMLFGESPQKEFLKMSDSKETETETVVHKWSKEDYEVIDAKLIDYCKTRIRNAALQIKNNVSNCVKNESCELHVGLCGVSIIYFF